MRLEAERQEVAERHSGSRVQQKQQRGRPDARPGADEGRGIERPHHQQRADDNADEVQQVPHEGGAPVPSRQVDAVVYV